VVSGSSFTGITLNLQGVEEIMSNDNVYICVKCKQQHYFKKKKKPLVHCIMCGGKLLHENVYKLAQGKNNVRNKSIKALADYFKKKDRPVNNDRERGERDD
jgi:DNA-directed RNA polymerase subunit RPC12/RpoP